VTEKQMKYVFYFKYFTKNISPNKKLQIYMRTYMFDEH
jgi:hypothetical protein